MCGIVGWITAEKGSDAYDRRKFIDQALILDTVRGGDSTGVFVCEHVPPKDKTTPWPNWRKQVAGGHEFVITAEYKKLFDNKTMDYKFAVGHNRSATIGGVNVEAAHPFIAGPITLVHNGTVNHGEVAFLRNKHNYINDSQTICHMLAEDTPEKVVSQLDGAFALAWHDQRDDSLNFIRNSQRPLHFSKVGGQDTIYFASEAEMLYWLDKRLVLKLQDIVSLKPNHWLKFHGPKLMVPEVKELEMHRPKASALGPYQQADWSGTGASSGTPTLPRSGTGTQSYPTGQRTAIKPHVRPKGGSFSKLIPQQMQEDLLELNLFVDEPQDFVPISSTLFNWHGLGSEDSTVHGWLMPEDKTYNPIPAIIHGLSPATYMQYSTRVWSVIPLGVSYLNWNLPIITCRVKTAGCDTRGELRSIPPSAMPPPFGQYTKWKLRSTYTPPKADPLPQEVDDPAEVPTFPGPYNRQLTKAEWLQATNGGCGDCGCILETEEHAFDLEWINTDCGHIPVCANCIEERIKDGGDDAEAIIEALENSDSLGKCNIDPEGL